MPNALNIQKEDPNIPSWWLFKELREKGLDHIAAFSGELWTDHNLHDPGITILEALCYAISDLGYRTTLDVEELLAPTFGSSENNFFTPEQILTCNPLTILDYQKMLVDIPGIRNAWLVPADRQEVPLYIDCENDLLQYSPLVNDDRKIGALTLNGLYKVYLDIDPVLSSSNTSNSCDLDTLVVDQVLEKVKERLHQHRNICEDFLDIIVLQDEEIGVCGDIELEPNANPDEVLEEIYEVIESFLSPRLKFSSLKEMIDAGKSLEEIFEGRPFTQDFRNENGKYSHGFVDTKQLEKTELPEQLFASDFYRVIMDVKGVRAIKSLLLNNFKDGTSRTNGEAWALQLTKNHRPLFSPEESFFNFFKGVIRISGNKQKATNRFKKRLQDFRKNKFDPSELDLSIPYGNNRSDLSSYRSIQHEFPLVYGIGKGHLSDEASEQRKVEALQLKAYLTFYDQLLAGYLSQLSNIRQLFSWNIEGEKQTYFQQALDDEIPKADEIFLSKAQSSDSVNLQEGDVLAMPAQPFSHPTDRDMAIIQLVELFNTFSSEDGNQIIDTIEEEDGTFRFYVKGKGGDIALQSKTTYASAKEAARASEVLFFQGTLESSYQHNNWPELSEYSFSFVYNPIQYTDYLKTITENEDAFYERKDQFLNHLLARFGEQFTEYVLLMYALNQEAPDPKTIIEDKARFLSNYPDISRNRGRGFDYTRKDNLWDSKENISGFEKRVAGLMGIADWERRYLNNFEVVLREQQIVLLIKDHRGTVLFETLACYDPEELKDETGKIKPEFINEFAALLCNPNNYEAYDCINESVYGFQLCQPDGKVFANYQRNYGSAALRDEIMTCTINYFNGDPEVNGVLTNPDTEADSETKNFLGQIVKIISEEEGYYFLLLSDDGQDVYLKSSIAYETEKEACHAWVELAELAKKPDNYINTTDNYEGGDYGFVIYKKTTDGRDEELEALAFHPKGYPTKAVRTKKKNAIIKVVSKKKLEYQIIQKPDYYSWSLIEEDDTILLNSYQGHKFKNEAQAFDAWGQFKDYGLERTNYRKRDSLEGYSFLIYKEEIPLAQSPFYETEEERDIAFSYAQEKFKNGVLEYNKVAKVYVNATEGAFFFIVLGSDNQQTLIGVQTYACKQEAACAYYHFLDKACDSNSYVELEEGGTCYFSFKITDGTTDLAYHPESYLQQAAKDKAQTELIDYIKNNKLSFKTELLPGAFHFEICWENCEGQCKTLFIENGKHDTALAAQLEAIAFLSAAAEWQEESFEENDLYSFRIKDNQGIVLANHGLFYETAAQRDRVYADADAYKENYISLTDDPEKFFEEIIKEKNKWEICGESCEDEDEVCLMSGFRLCKTDKPIACHPVVFNNTEDQNLMIQQLLNKAQCNQLFYTDLCLQGTKLTAKIDDKYHYKLWLNKPSILLWQSETTYNSSAEALIAFEKNWLKIIELARDKNNYKLPEESFPYVSLWNKEERIAYYPETESDAEVAIDNLYRIAKQYPIYTVEKAYGFRLLNEELTKVLWKSSLQYASTKEALTAFRFFLNLLKQETSYRRNNNKTTCIYKIEIGETLLEGNRSYADIYDTSISAFKTLAEDNDSTIDNTKTYAICPAIFESNTIQAGTDEILVSNDCNDFENADCIETICPAAWDVGLQSFLIDAINEENYYTFVDHQHYCNLGFRIVTEKYRVARNVREFHLPEKQSGFKDWLYGYSRCDKEVIVDLPKNASLCKTNGLYYYYVKKDGENFWISFKGYEKEKDAEKAFFEEIYDFYAYAQELDFYGLTKTESSGVDRVLQLLKEDGSVMALSCKTFQNQEEWNEAVINCILSARKFPYFCYEEKDGSKKFGFQCFALEKSPAYQAPPASDCQQYHSDDIISVLADDIPGEVIWESIHDYNSQFEVTCAFEAFLDLLKDKQNYQAIQLQDCNLFGLELTHPAEVLATHPQRYFTQTDLDKAIKRTQECINAEGFHLIEHILLRPKKGISNHITIQFYESSKKDCEGADGDFTDIKQPYLLIQEVFIDQSKAETVKKRLITEIRTCLMENIDVDAGTIANKNALSEKLNQVENNRIVSVNMDRLITTLIAAVQLAKDNGSIAQVDGLWTIPENFLDSIIFCFNKADDTASDKLIPICPDCDHIEPLPEEDTSIACIDPKKELADSSIISTGSDGCTSPDTGTQILGLNSLNIAETETIHNAIIDTGTQTMVLDTANSVDVFSSMSDEYYVAGADPYSFWTTIVLPYWPKRFQNANFRSFFENTLRREAPAHLGLRICWLDPKQMRRFESAYRDWLEAFSGNEDCNLQEAQYRLICILFDEEDGLTSVYPPARLQEGDCEQGGTTDPGSVLLDFTQLG